MTRSTGKVFATDLTKVDQPTPMEAEDRIKTAKEKILAGFAEKLDEVVSGYTELALYADDEDVRRKASERILDSFAPVQGRGQLQQAPGTTIQILNALPIPEVKMVDGKEAPMIEMGEVKYALTSPKKRTILPEPAPERKERYLGPASVQNGQATGATIPAPLEIPTPIKK